MNESDWKIIRHRLETGDASARELGREYGVSHTTINKRAKDEGWEKPKKKVSTKKVSTKVSTRKVESGNSETGNPHSQKTRGKKSKSRSKNTSLSPSTDDTDIPFNPDEFGISDQQAQFAMLVAQGKKLIEAYRLAGYEGEGATANSNASRMLRNAKVYRAISYFRNQYQKRYTADLDLLVSQLMTIVQADPNELAQHRRVNCRYCWGEKHLYQWRDIAEFDKAAAQASKDGKPEPEYGGLGFVDNAVPNPDCPKCCGEGRGEIHIADTTMLDGDARLLYAGAKYGKFGVEILMEDKAAARRELLRLVAAGGALSTDKRLQELEIERRRIENQKLLKESERLEQEIELKRKGKGEGDEPTVIIKLVNSPDGD